MSKSQQDFKSIDLRLSIPDKISLEILAAKKNCNQSSLLRDCLQAIVKKYNNVVVTEA